MGHDDVVQLLVGWGAWAKTDTGGPRIRTRAGSVEGRFFAEAGDIYVVDRRPHRAIITDELALQVDLAVGSVDYQYTMILLYVFVRGMTPAAAGGRLKVDAAVRAVSDRLTGWPDQARRGDHPQGGGDGTGDVRQSLGPPALRSHHTAFHRRAWPTPRDHATRHRQGESDSTQTGERQPPRRRAVPRRNAQQLYGR